MNRRIPPSRLSNDTPASAGYRVFIDFDNTISAGDVLDGIIERFAADPSWRTFEDSWAAGKIGTRACLEGQMLALRASWAELAAHLDDVKLDPGFVRLRDLLRREKIELTILSDNFDLFVGHILKRHALADVAYFANHAEMVGDRVIPSFPFGNPTCPECAHCKKTHFTPRGRDTRRVVYIGDGRSDRCPSRHADLVFAKDSLLLHLLAAGIPCTPYANLTEVSDALQIIINEESN